MASLPAHQKNNKLVDVGLAGFAFVDEFYGSGPKKSRGAVASSSHKHPHPLFSMAPPQPRQKNNMLVEVAEEDFSVLDEWCGRSSKKSARPRNNKPRRNKPPATAQAYDDDHHHQHYHYNRQYPVYWGPQVVTVREPVITSSQAAQLNGGMEIVDVDHTIRKPIGRAY